LIETRRYFTVTINWTRLSLGITLVFVSLMMAYFGITGTVVQMICLLSFATLERKTLKALLKKLRTVLAEKLRGRT